MTSPHHIPGISAIVLSWKRTHNLTRILDSLKACELVKEVFVWNNNPSVDLSELADGQVTVLSSSRNFRAFSRYCVVPLTSSETILFQDDDLLFPPESVESLYAEFLKDRARIYGHKGRNLSEGGQYVRKEIYGDCDIVLGQMTLFSRELLSSVYGSFLRLTPFDRGDDIAFSLLCGVKHRAIKVAHEDLGTRDEAALFGQPGHFELRQNMVDRILKARRPSERRATSLS